MEPMTLGSAPSSPSSPAINPNFLPSFLMGDTSQSNTPNPNSTSPGRNSRKQGPNFPRLFNQSLIESPIPGSKQPFAPHKPGPPNQGLFDLIEQKRKPTSPVMNSTVAPFTDSPHFSRNISRVNLTEDSLNCSRVLDETFNNQSNLSRFDKIDTHWVTVFGFPPSALSLVLAQLSNCGIIVKKVVPPQGNWAHVRFNSLSEVPRALALNGRRINAGLMIGVSLCYDVPDTPGANKENDAIFASPIRARSLRQSYISPSNSNSVMPPQNVPQKSTGIVSKAIEYVFGW